LQESTGLLASTVEFA